MHREFSFQFSRIQFTGLKAQTVITEQQLKDAPEFSDDSRSDRVWETSTHRNYGVKPYWDASAST